jgi:hypothetical protein
MRTSRFFSDMMEFNAAGGKQSMKQAPGALLGADSSVEMERMQVELWRNMPALEKARAVGQVSRSVRELSMAGIRSRHPSASKKECSLRYAVLTLGRSLACQAYPEVGRLSDL